EFWGNRIGRIALDGAMTEYPLPSAFSGAQEVAVGPAGTIWFTEFLGNRIGRLSLDIDRTPPTITAPAGVVVDATTPDGATAQYVVTANDDVDGAVAVVCTPASGSEFRIGETNVSCTATDAAGNVSTVSFVVTVK